MMGGSSGPVTQAYIDSSGNIVITAVGNSSITISAGTTQNLIGTYVVGADVA